MKLKPYSEYKDSGVEWIGELPKEWEINKIKYTSYVKGRIGWQGLKADEFIDEGPYLITGTNFRDGNIDWENCYHISEERYKQDSFIHVKENDIIITKDGTIGKVAFISNLPDKTSLNSHLLIIRPLYNLYCSKYLFWLLQSRVFLDYIEISKVGTTFYGITQEEVEKFKFPIPSLDEQINIEKYLDKKTSEIDLTIEKDTRLIELLKEKRTALINHVVTKGLDPTVKMKDSGVEWIGEIPEDWDINRLKFLTATKAQYGANEEPEYNENKFDYRYVRITDVNNKGGLRKDSFAYLSRANARGFVLNEGDVLFARSGATVGKVYYYSLDDGNCCFAGYMIRYVANGSLLDPRFLLYYSLSKSYKEWIKIVSTQSTIENVSAEKYDELHIPTPKISQQEQIVKFLDKEIPQIDGIILKIEEKISLLEEYKKSLIHHVVTGKVDVREVAV